jgi:hypothetical protein
MGHPDDEGYATPAATVISAAIGMVVTVVILRSLADLRLAQAELARTTVEYGLDAAQAGAMLSVATSSQPPPYHWTLASLGVAVDVVAEPERPKMAFEAFTKLDDATMSKLGVGNPDLLRGELGGGSSGPAVVWVADQAASPVWRSCAASYVSQFGQADTLPALDYHIPVSGKQPGFWRAGEVWRIQVTNPDGWRDERIVRFTGNGLNPAAVLGRRLSRGWKGAMPCQDLFDAGGPA